MDDYTGQRASSARSINSIEISNSASSRGSNRIPPTPPPKPKINVKGCLDAGPKDDVKGDKIAVRQAILKGSKNPTGSSYGESYEDVIRDIERLTPLGNRQLLEFPRCQINSLSTRSSVISNEERDANLDIIFSDWNSEAFSKRQSSFEPKRIQSEVSDEPQRHSFHSPRNSDLKSEPELHLHKNDRKLQAKLDFPGLSHVNGRDKKQERENSDAVYLLPRLEKQSNQVVVLAENNPTYLKDDVIRNCDIVEEKVPEFGHTEHLLKYWKIVEASPEKDERTPHNNNNLHLGAVTCDQNKDLRMTSDNVDLQKSISNESNHEQDLNEILQEFENFNKDFLDSNIFLERGASKDEKVNSHSRSNDIEDDYAATKYDVLPSDRVNGEGRHDSKSFDHRERQEEGVYSELEDHPTRESPMKIVEPAQELNSEKVKLIGFRKLGSVDDDSEASNSVTNFQPAPYNIAEPSQGNDAVKVEVSQADKLDKKKNSSKQKCLIM